MLEKLAMASRRKTDDKISAADTAVQNLPFALYRSFAELVGVSVKLCGMDGQLLPGASAVPVYGPCTALRKGKKFREACAKNHAAFATMAMELRRPYISSCHMRLVTWAVPILYNDEPLPAVIICGGALLREPDIALIRHIESAATELDLDAAKFRQTLDSAPVFSRARIRAIADFLFRTSSVFAAYASLPDAPEVIAQESVKIIEQAPIVFPPRAKKESAKTKRRQAAALERQNVEDEIVRLIRERKPDEALRMLVEHIEADDLKSGSGTGNLDVAENFTRLFRKLSTGSRIPQGLYRKQSDFITKVMSAKQISKDHDAAEKLCRDFLLIAEELTGKPRSRQVKTIQKYLAKNLTRKLTLATVGAKFDLKERALDALIRKNFGMSFTDYVTSLRLSEAKRLLTSSDYNFGEIARRSGFKDQSYFTKVFKTNIGSTPTEFRKKTGSE